MANIIQYLISIFIEWLKSILTASHVTPSLIDGFTIFLSLVSLFTITLGACYLVRQIIKQCFIFLSKWLKMKFFGLLIDNRFHYFFSFTIPYYLILCGIPIIVPEHPDFINLFNKLLYIYLIFILIRSLMTIITAGFDTLRKKENYHDRPISSYRQVIQIVLIILGIGLILSNLMNESLGSLFAAMGAASAIFLLMFKDMIMGFVASVQVTSNDMVRIGDWITMPKYGADGDVIEITLTTVKVSNFDKTITTIPTYALISDSFQNWRGMIQSGGRRIKRAIIIKQSSIRYIADEEIERFRKIQGITIYIDQRQEEIHRHNEAIGADRSIPINGRNLTNAGLFRKYTEWYLKNHPGTNKNMTLMVRQLAPTEIGIPIELYVFTNTTKWVDYEYIMADIFDHLIASVRYFDLHIYERQSGSDIQRVEIVDNTFNQYL